MSLPDILPHDQRSRQRPDLLDPSLVVGLLRPLSPSRSPSSTFIHPQPSTPNRARKEKTRIELAPDQPLTTQGKPRARVYVACLQCRTRKIRCDGAKPTCHNCARRAKSPDLCVYDAAPRRRGPDKTPGARHRMTREACQESDADTVTSRRSHRIRRKRHHDASPPPQSSSCTLPASPLPHAPLRQPSLVLDPQLADIPPFHSPPAASPPPLRPDSSLTASGSAISDPLAGFPDDTLYHMTSSQVLT